MGFFKDFKDDFSKAVDELLPENENMDLSDQMVNTLDSGATEGKSQDAMKEWLEEFVGKDTNSENDNASEDDTEKEPIENAQENDEKYDDGDEASKETIKDQEGEGVMEENIDLELIDALSTEGENGKEEVKEKENKEKGNGYKLHAASLADDDEVTIISKGTTIDGNISAKGSMEIQGNVTGDVECLGKLTVTGKVTGNLTAAEVYVNTERLEGAISSQSSVKIGLGTVLIGNITGTSAVIAGAVKGDIDINGPVVIDSTAVIKGNIKAKSMQINNGAIIDGYCSLAYSDINLDNIFD